MFENRQQRKLEDGFTGIDQVTAVVPIFALIRAWLILWIVVLISKFFLVSELPHLEHIAEISFDLATYAICVYIPIRACLIVLEVRHHGYKWDEIGLHIKRGYLTRRVTMVPRDRIQRIEVHQSLMHRMLEYGNFSAITAGSRLNQIQINGMREREMFRLRDVVVTYLSERDSKEP